MKRSSVGFLLAALAIFSQTNITAAQTDFSTPVPGGATAATVFCLQAGELSSGAFVSTYVQVSPKVWEEKAFLRNSKNRFEETRRDDQMVELFDRSRSLQLIFDFPSKKIKFTASGSTEKELSHILNATDNASSSDCVALAARSGAPSSAQTGGAGASPIVNIFVRPGTALGIPPGTRLTATSGPPCPGNPGFFLCPNRFTCAPVGGVCCPGAGACNAGTFCDKFINAACIAPGSPRFCAGSGNPVTGVSLHCAPGKACAVGNLCL